jgi:hypothetical protein
MSLNPRVGLLTTRCRLLLNDLFYNPVTQYCEGAVGKRLSHRAFNGFWHRGIPGTGAGSCALQNIGE